MLALDLPSVLALAGIGSVIIAALISGVFALRAAEASRRAEPAKAHADTAVAAAERADQTALAFAAGFSDLYRKIEECKAEARGAKDAAREAQAAEGRCIAEQKRLEAVMEGILSERRQQH